VTSGLLYIRRISPTEEEVLERLTSPSLNKATKGEMAAADESHDGAVDASPGLDKATGEKVTKRPTPLQAQR
jgi:hypothetical protein